VALDDEPSGGQGRKQEQSNEEVWVRRRNGSGGLSPTSKSEGIRPPWHVGWRQPAVTGAGALSAVSAMTTW
jgi:hypothetical protein